MFPMPPVARSKLSLSAPVFFSSSILLSCPLGSLGSELVLTVNLNVKVYCGSGRSLSVHTPASTLATSNSGTAQAGEGSWELSMAVAEAVQQQKGVHQEVGGWGGRPAGNRPQESGRGHRKQQRQKRSVWVSCSNQTKLPGLLGPGLLQK